MKKGQQTEKPMPTKCLICAATPVDPSTEGKGADYAFCAGHLATLHDTPAQRARLRQVQADVMLKRVAIAVDANGVGWFHHLPPQPPPRGVPLIQDDGSPTYLDWRSDLVGGDNDGGE
ncbi:MAG: hypothetical protein WBE69_00720 [Candidatus Binataceae bacterium]